MKIFLSKEPVFGPWGGGSKFVNRLFESLKRKGHEVCFSLNEENINIIFCFDPRSSSSSRGYLELLEYKERNKIPIIQRVGDVGTHGKPDLHSLVIETTKHSDFVIFPSKWSKDHIGFIGDNCEIIFNSPHESFYKNRNTKTILGNTTNLVTHHWSTNSKKGFDFYKLIEEYVNFTYIGRIPDNFKFDNATYYSPMDADSLSSTLHKFDIYVTASQEEAGANHVLEAIASGLPVLYKKNGGSINEYCKNFGEEFDDLDSFFKKYELIVNNYSKYKEKVLDYSSTIDDTINRYIEIIERFE